MAEYDDEPGGTDRPGAAPEPADAAAPDEPTPTVTHPVIPPEPASAPVLKTRWRDRAWSFRAMIAVAVASVLVGGVAGGAVVAAAGNDNERDHGYFRMGPGGPGGPMGPGWRGRGPGQLDKGGPGWRWDDNDATPGQGSTPGAPNVPAPSPSPGSTG
jgi:hypothetical protein